MSNDNFLTINPALMEAALAQTQTLAPAPEGHRLFAIMGGVAALLAAALPIGIVFYWLSTPPAGLAGVPLFMGMVISLIGVAPLSWGLLRLRRCFGEFGAGRLFSAAGISGLRDFAIGTAISAALRPVATALLSVLISAGQPGPHSLVLELSSDTVILGLFAATIATLSWAMQKAAALAEENNRFV